MWPWPSLGNLTKSFFTNWRHSYEYVCYTVCACRDGVRIMGNLLCFVYISCADERFIKKRTLTVVHWIKGRLCMIFWLFIFFSSINNRCNSRWYRYCVNTAAKSIVGRSLLLFFIPLFITGARSFVYKYFIKSAAKHLKVMIMRLFLHQILKYSSYKWPLPSPSTWA